MGNSRVHRFFPSILLPSNVGMLLYSAILRLRTSVPLVRMQIFNISDLFATPVAAAIATTDTLNKTSRRRRRKPAHVALPTTNCAEEPISNHSDGNHYSTVDTKTFALCDKATNTVANKKKKQKKKRNPKAADELPSEVTSINYGHSNSDKSDSNVNDGAPQNKVTENMRGEVQDLMASLELITSQRNALEKSLNELREENDRLARNNEDLKDELKEMTDETLELSVEKQRLLSKIGTLKKQLLNRPK